MKSTGRKVLIGMLAVSAGISVLEGLALWTARRENGELRAGLERAGKGRKGESDKTAKREAELQVLRVQVQDLLKLRNEARQLRALTNETARLQEENRLLKEGKTNGAPVAVVIPTTDPEEAVVSRENWTFAGYATPEATLQSSFWALREGDLDAYLEAMTAENRMSVDAQIQNEEKTPEELAAEIKRSGASVEGFQILEQTAVTEESIMLRVQMSGGGNAVHHFMFTRVGNEWKMSDAGVEQ
jgi:hypothetical protein